MMRVIVKASPNVALAKYWGKRDSRLNLPFTGSLSITLGGLETVADIQLTGSGDDEVGFDGVPAGAMHSRRISDFLDLVRRMAGRRERARVNLVSNFPVAAGIASSASVFAALAVGAARAYDLDYNPQQLSILARRGSGSASRSLYSGFAEWLPGKAADGSDSFAVQIAPPQHWPLGVVVAVTDTQPKSIGSREGMAQAVQHSPFFRAWCDSHTADLDEIREGIRSRDLHRVGTVAEHNCLKMHAICLGAQPPLLYWRPATLAVMERVRSLRDEGQEAYFTIDAGPQVKVICPMPQRGLVAAALASVPGVQQVLLSEPGPAPQILEAV
jgi:diphosphomevalonate decarboxylase